MSERGFVPGALAAIDLDGPLQGLSFEASPEGVPYGSLLALVRLHDDPLLTLELPLRDGKIEPAELADQIWARARTELEAHVRAHNCVSSDALSRDALLGGLASDACPVRALRPGNAPFVTVVVPTARRPERVRACIENLAAMSYPNFEILIVDNAPDDRGTAEAVRECALVDARVRYVAEPLPGSSVARNRGAREAASEIVAFADDDIEVDAGWLSWMVEPFVSDEQVDVVTGLVLPKSLDTPQQRWFEQVVGFGKGLEPRRYDTGPNRPGDRLLFPYWGPAFGTGASMAFRRTVLVAIGGFDPALGTGSPALAGSDVEALSHVVIRGGRLAYEPRALCWHNHRASEAALRSQTFTYAVGATAIFTKWLLRDPRLFGYMLREAARLARAAPHGRARRGAKTVEGSRLATQLRMNRRRGLLRRQLGGYAAGPLLYLRSLAWVRRRRLRDVLPAGALGDL